MPDRLPERIGITPPMFPRWVYRLVTALANSRPRVHTDVEERGLSPPSRAYRLGLLQLLGVPLSPSARR